MTTELETPRLLLKPLELTDADQIQALFPHWEIVRFLTKAVPWPYPPDGALTFLRDSAFPQWSVATPGTGRCASKKIRSS